MSPSDDERALETSREELYDLVWRYPGVAIAQKFRCTEAYLRRVCKALDIPRPARGWWTRGAAGIAVSPPPALPALKHGCPDRWTHGRSVRRWLRHHEVNIFSPQQRLHPLINVAMSIFRGAKQSLDGTHLMPRSDYAIDLTVSAEALEAGLTLANGLFMQFETRNHTIRILRANEGYIRPDLNAHPRASSLIGRTRSAVWSPKAPTIAFVCGVPIGLAVIEVRKEVLMRYIGDGEFQLASAKMPVYGVTWTEWPRDL
jgi:hypothetical protein